MSDEEPVPSIWSRLVFSATGWIMAANIAMFAYLVWLYGADATEHNVVLFAYGAKYNPAIDRGEYWRLVTSNFLHSGPLHLCVNMYALAQMGLACEMLFGTAWFLAICVGAGVAGAYTGWRGHEMLSVGASGSICGLGGALVALGFLGKNRVPPELGAQLRRGAMPFVVGNAAIGLLVGNIDNHAHGGGFVGGFAIGGLIVLLARWQRIYQLVGVLGAIAALGAVGWAGRELVVRLPEGRAAVEVVAFIRDVVAPLEDARKSLGKELKRLYPKGSWEPPADRARGMATRKALLAWLDARATFRAAELAWPEPSDPAIRVALADVRKREPDLKSLRDRIARYADRTVDEELAKDQAEHPAEWKLLMNLPLDEPMKAMNERFQQVYPMPKKK